jgi:O-antigen/teichoic acid export membrane protein
MRAVAGLRNYASLSTANVVQLGLSFLALAVIARYLGVDGLGAVTVLLAGYLFGSAFGDFTLPIPLGGLVNSEGFGRAGVGSFDRFRCLILIIIWSLSLPILFVSTSTTIDMICLGAMAGVLSSLSESWLLLATGRVNSVAVGETSGRAAYLLLLLVALPIKPTPAIVAACLACSALVVVVLTRLMTRRVRMRLMPGSQWHVTEFARLGGPALLSRLATYGYGPGSLILFAGILSPTQLGLLGASDRVVRALQSLIYPLSLSLFPFFAERSEEADRKLKSRATKGTLAALLVGSTVALITLAFAPVVVHILYGDQFGEAIPVLRLEVLLLVPFSVSNFLLTNLVLGRQDTLGSLVIASMGLLVLAGAVLFVWLHSPSALMAALAMLLAEAAVLLTTALRLRRRVAVGMRR